MSLEELPEVDGFSEEGGVFGQHLIPAHGERGAGG